MPVNGLLARDSEHHQDNYARETRWFRQDFSSVKPLPHDK